MLLISPHLDDAVFSCAARIAREAETGAKVTVATVFSHACRGSKAGPGYAARREEDRRGVRRLGATPRWLGLVDAPERNPFYADFRSIVLGTAPEDRATLAVVRRRLAGLLAELTPDVLYLPLGVGTHIDHRLVFAAATALPATCPRLFYEDQPYAMVDGAVGLRLAELGLAPVPGDRGAAEFQPATPQRTARFLRSFRSAPYVRRYLPAGPERKAVEAMLCRGLSAPMKPSGWITSETEEGDPSHHSRIVQALYGYRSQARAFLGPRTKFLAASRRHARALGVTGFRGERYWSLVGKGAPR